MHPHWDGIILESSFEKNSKYEIILKFRSLDNFKQRMVELSYSRIYKSYTTEL